MVPLGGNLSSVAYSIEDAAAAAAGALGMGGKLLPEGLLSLVCTGAISYLAYLLLGGTLGVNLGTGESGTSLLLSIVILLSKSASAALIHLHLPLHLIHSTIPAAVQKVMTMIPLFDNVMIQLTGIGLG